MAQVTVRINGFSYTVGCEDGQEDHLQAMASQVEDRINSVKSIAGQSGESRLLVLAALLMADELHDTGVEMASLRSAKPRGGDPRLAQKLNQLASRAEEIATQLERS